MSIHEFRACSSELWMDPNVLFILWITHDPGPKEERKCKVASVYVEAMDEDPARLWKPHLDEWARFCGHAENLDCAFAHTPWMAEMIGRAGLPVHVMPVGWDAEAMGSPRPRHKHVDLSYHGSTVRRRWTLIPMIQEIITYRFANFSGMFGRELLGRLDASVASLYVGHSDIGSYSTWRLWQTASTSAALISEPGDTWPFEAGKHYLEIPKFTEDNVREIVQTIQNHIGNRSHMAEVSGEAHELARRYTIDSIEDNYIVPVAAKL